MKKNWRVLKIPDLNKETRCKRIRIHTKRIKVQHFEEKQEKNDGDTIYNKMLNDQKLF